MRELRARVGRITITTVPRGADVTIDDRVLGKTPLDHPVIVGLGRVRVTATMAGHASATRELDVAAEDEVSVQLQLPLATAAGAALSLPGLDPDDAAPSANSAGSWRRAGWIATAVLGAGAIGMGVLALREGADLKSQRNLYVGDATPQSELDRQNHLEHLSSLTRTYSIVADSMGVAAVVVGAITLLSGLGSHGGEAAAAAAQISVGPRAMNLRLTF